VNGFVCVDASVAVKWVIPEDDSDRARDLYVRAMADRDAVIAPPHMPIEVLNAIRKQVGRRELTPMEGEEAVTTFLDFNVSLAAPRQLYPDAMELALRFDRPTVYDTHYVALAQIAECEMWTADRRLLNALGGRLPFVKDIAEYVTV
jgi:predicted nucleic acid-binding protein